MFALSPTFFDISKRSNLPCRNQKKQCNFDDDSTFYACGEDLLIRSLINKLEHNNFLSIKWFENNPMKLDQEKCNLSWFLGINIKKFAEPQDKDLRKCCAE